MVTQSLRRRIALARLLRWLGPWTPADVVPSGVRKEIWPVVGADGRSTLTWLFGDPATALGVLVISPGLHYDGPADPRFVRFASVLANAGFLVVAPFVEDHLGLLIDLRATADFESVVTATCDRFPELGAPTIFSISFGSFPALAAAAKLGERIDGVVVFGGYADFTSVARFCVDGSMFDGKTTVRAPFDRSNLPALFLNLARHLVTGDDVKVLEGAYLHVCRQSWGTPSRSDRRFLDEIVDAHEATLPEHLRVPFRVGCGRDPGAADLVSAALETGRDDYARFDPRALVHTIRRPVVVVHGKDDDVIPWSEAVELAREVAPHTRSRLYMTGLLSHTGHGEFHPILALRESSTLVSIANVLSNAGRLRDVVR